MIGSSVHRRVSAIVMALALALCLATPARPTTAQPLPDQPVEDPAKIRELAERLLANASSGLAFEQLGSRPQLTARLLPGRVPEGLPINLPVPQGGQIVGSVARMLGNQLAGAEVLVDFPGTTGEAQTLYENAFAEQAWGAPIGYSAGGVQQVRTMLPFYRCLGDEWAFAMMTFRQLGSGRTDAQFSFSLAPMTRASSAAAGPTSGPCTAFHTGGAAAIGPAAGSPALLAPLTPPPATAGTAGGLAVGPAAGSPTYRRDLLPVLEAPTGSRLQDMGGAMGTDYAVSDATVNSNRSAGELEAHFATQLERTGWVRERGGDAGAVAFSGWLLPHEPGWYGMLTIMQTPEPNRYALTLRVETSGSTTLPAPTTTDQPNETAPPQD